MTPCHFGVFFYLNIYVEKLEIIVMWLAFLGNYECRNPTLAKCGGEAQHFQSWGFEVLRDSRMFRVQQKGPKHLALRCSWCHWKGLEP